MRLFLLFMVIVRYKKENTKKKGDLYMRKARISIFVISAIAATALLVGSIVILAGEEQEYNDYTNEVEELKFSFQNLLLLAKEQTEEAQANGTSTYSLPENMSGWIAVPGTNIDYPLMTASDDFYLAIIHTRRSSLGSIFYYNSQCVVRRQPKQNVVFTGHRYLTPECSAIWM